MIALCFVLLITIFELLLERSTFFLVRPRTVYKHRVFRKQQKRQKLQLKCQAQGTKL